MEILNPYYHGVCQSDISRHIHFEMGSNYTTIYIKYKLLRVKITMYIAYWTIALFGLMALFGIKNTPYLSSGGNLNMTT